MIVNDQLSMDFTGADEIDPRDPSRADSLSMGRVRPAGLTYISQFLSAKQQETIVNCVDGMEWRNDLERRVQHYGWRYDYRARTVDADMRIGPLPGWLLEVALRLYRHETRPFDRIPDQAIVNEYLPGQGIAMHVDRQCFGPAVATISLGDAWRMDLRPTRGVDAGPEHILLEPGSALIMIGEARSRWLHGIAKRKRERTDDGWRPRKRRISLTFRTVLTEAQDTRDASAAEPSSARAEPISAIAEAPNRAYAGSTTSGRPSAGLGMGMTRQRGR